MCCNHIYDNLKSLTEVKGIQLSPYCRNLRISDTAEFKPERWDETLSFVFFSTMAVICHLRVVVIGCRYLSITPGDDQGKVFRCRGMLTSLKEAAGLTSPLSVSLGILKIKCRFLFLASKRVSVKSKSAADVNEDGHVFHSVLVKSAEGHRSCQDKLLFQSQISGVWLQCSEVQMLVKSGPADWLSEADKSARLISNPQLCTHAWNFHLNDWTAVLQRVETVVKIWKSSYFMLKELKIHQLQFSQLICYPCDFLICTFFWEIDDRAMCDAPVWAAGSELRLMDPCISRRNGRCFPWNSASATDAVNGSVWVFPGFSDLLCFNIQSLQYMTLQLLRTDTSPLWW